MTRRSLLGSLSFMALTVVGCAAMLLPAALSNRAGTGEAPPFSLVDDAGGGSESPGGGEPSGSADPSTPPQPGPGNPMPGGNEDNENTKTEGGGSGGGLGDLSFGVETALSMGLLALFALFLIPGRRPPRSAGGRTGR
ncbi:hypothetical protein AB0I28_34695 [Phytomonospora sp. NPDC050363]|uniref:hypothetical protein n=1 Tax=Phytomonospora sp. NPDC050363 TaxID=3155642 RepID=UPI0033C44F1E